MMNLKRYLYTGPLCLLLATAGCGGSMMPGAPTIAAPSQPPPAPQQAGSVTVSPQNAALAAGQRMSFTATVTGGGTISWSVNGIAGGNATVGTVDSAGNYTAPNFAASSNAVVEAALASAPQTNFATAVVGLIQSGQVQPTSNPQVALYTMNLPQPGTVSVQFGTDTTYGMRTWAQPTPSVPHDYGGQVTIQVAGMRGSTNYHLRALVTLANGVTYQDGDHTFATGIPPLTSSLQISTPSGLSPQPGIQLFDTISFGPTPYNPKLAQAFATDLQGNVIWTYSYSKFARQCDHPHQAFAQRSLSLVLTVSSGPTNSVIPAGTANDVREIDLVGNTIHDLSMAALNQSLEANGFSGLNLFAFSRDVLALPNGHFVFLAQMAKGCRMSPDIPAPTNVAGDVLVDVDQNYKPDWVWNSFDHLDINRHPFQFPPDWTHSDALLYSTDDHDLLLSIRNQNWIVKIDLQGCRGHAATSSGAWARAATFSLLGGVDPTDWFYAQHGMNFFSANTSGQFRLGLLDDGDDRQFPGRRHLWHFRRPPRAPIPRSPCCWWMRRQEPPRSCITMWRRPALYSLFGGQADLLPNGDIEVDFCAANAGATVQEYQPGAAPVETAPQIVWQAVSPGYDQYRSMRRPSLYPGVQW